MNGIEIVFLALIEGLTEFLPVSSTGHLILASAWLGLHENVFVQNFNIIIQFGAILAVLVLYWKKFFPLDFVFYRKLLLSFLPAAVLGFALKSHIDTWLGSLEIVAWALLLGGVAFIWTEKSRPSDHEATLTVAKMQPLQCLILGTLQCFALIPGVSRSGATILAGVWMGLSRKEATEYSFFLAIPTLTAAALYKTLKILPVLSWDQAEELALGTFLSFVFALLAIRFLIGFVQKRGLAPFGWYRIVLGCVLLIALWRGLIP